MILYQKLKVSLFSFPYILCDPSFPHPPAVPYVHTTSLLLRVKGSRRIPCSHVPLSLTKLPHTAGCVSTVSCVFPARGRHTAQTEPDRPPNPSPLSTLPPGQLRFGGLSCGFNGLKLLFVYALVCLFFLNREIRPVWICSSSDPKWHR